MDLRELIEGLDLKVKFGSEAKTDGYKISRVSVDSRTADEGSVFAPILGYRYNGADFVTDAYRGGCRIFLSETDAEPKTDCVIIKTKNLRKSVAELTLKLYDISNKALKIVGITGTKGKTGIAIILSKILSRAGVCAMSIGTVGVVDNKGKLICKTQNTTPEPTELFRIISDCAARGAEVIVLEVSSQALKDFRVYGLEFFAVIFSCIDIDHIGTREHQSFTEYICAKRTLFVDYKSKFKILNADDIYSPFIAFGTEKCIKCGFGERSDYRLSDYIGKPDGATFKLSGLSVFSAMPARYDAMNAALALVAASCVSGKGLNELIPFLSDITVPGRYERYILNGRIFIIDYAHNRISFISVFELTRKMFSGKIIAVFGSVGERSMGRRRELGEACEKYADYSIITADNPCFEPVIKICGEIRHYFKDKSKCEIITDREKAIYRAYEISSVGDVILLLGRGHEEEMEIMGKRIPFSERRIIEKMGGEKL